MSLAPFSDLVASHLVEGKRHTFGVSDRTWLEMPDEMLSVFTGHGPYAVKALLARGEIVSFRQWRDEARHITFFEWVLP